ncbi:MAG: SPOR domain-containing protein [Gallionellaceae bacterium]|jgi:hypothetical protein
MMKWIVGLLVLVNIIFFSIMQWGGALLVDSSNPPVQAQLHADKIKLIDLHAVSAAEPVSAMPVASSEVAMVSLLASTVLHEKLSCVDWGDFSAVDVLRAEKALAALKLGDKVKQRMVEYPSGFWIYIPPLKSRAEVDKKIAQLKVRGVQDYFVIQEAGVWQHAISLGVFKSEDLAKKYLAKLQTQGVRSALLGERASKLKYTALHINDLEPARYAEILALQKEYPDTEIKNVACH